MNQSTMNIVVAVNKPFVPYCYVMLTSLFMNNSNPVRVFVMHHELEECDENILNELCSRYPVTFEYLYIPDHLLPPEDIMAATPWGIETYFRLAVSDLLPADVDRALYLDSDMIVNGSLKELYFCDLGGKNIAACHDLHSTYPFNDYRDETFAGLIPDGFTYFNAGLTLFNIEGLRKSHNFQTYMDVIRSLNYKVHCPDQDALNYAHHNDIHFLDFKKYNLYARRAYTDFGMHYEGVKKNAIVIHYTNSKPWHGNCLHCDIEQLWWDYAKHTPFHYEFLQKIVEQVLTDSTLTNYTTDIQCEHQQLLHVVSQYETILKKAGIPF